MRLEEFDVDILPFLTLTSLTCIQIIKKRQPLIPKNKKRKRREGLDKDPETPPISSEERLVSFVDATFTGQLASILICQTCKHVSERVLCHFDNLSSFRSQSQRNLLMICRFPLNLKVAANDIGYVHLLIS
jgi:hypothetical protein